MTYQRNIESEVTLRSDDRGWGGGVLALENCLDDGVPDRVEQPEIGAGDHHEAERHGRALTDLAPVGPLDAPQLGVGRAQEVRRPAEDALARMRGLVGVVVLLDRRRLAIGDLSGLLELVAGTAGGGGALRALRPLG